MIAKPAGIALLLILAAFALPLSEARQAPEQAEAIFAGGCFWCMEPPFDKLDGVIATTTGYIGGDVANPDYDQVVSGETGHAEAVRVTYNPDRVTYDELLAIYWRNIDPLDDDGQFCDRGSQYRAALFPRDEDQKQQALRSRKALDESGRFDEPVVTTIEMAETFYPAEDYHQNYYQKNRLRYSIYRRACGRDRRLHTLWGE